MFTVLASYDSHKFRLASERHTVVKRESLNGKRF